MAIEPADVYWERMAQRRYDASFPWERIWINYYRGRAGKPPLKATASRRRA